ncbi:MAG: SH3 domain-containing protein [Aggregatilineales bacterium]
MPSNTPVALLQDASPEATAVMTSGYSVPVIQRFEDPYITFITVPYATEGAPQYPAYTSNIMGPTVTPNPSLTGFELDQNALGEALMLLHDEGYPEAFAPESGFAVPNMVGAYNPLTGAQANYLFAPGAYRVTLVQASELAAVSVADPSTGMPTAIRLFTRGGAPLDEVREPVLTVRHVTSVEGTIGGFIVAASPTSGPGGTTIYSVSTRPGSPDYFTPVSVWNSTLGANYRIVWVSDENATPAASVEAWAVLTSFSPPPTAAPLPVVAPTATPAAPAPPAPPAVPGGLYVGGQARVQTTAGDRLNVRTGPGRSFSVAVQARNGEIVAIVGGPTAADGYVWWQIRLSEGTVGWAVESADGVQTLIPIG